MKYRKMTYLAIQQDLVFRSRSDKRVTLWWTLLIFLLCFLLIYYIGIPIEWALLWSIVVSFFIYLFFNSANYKAFVGISMVGIWGGSYGIRPQLGFIPWTWIEKLEISRQKQSIYIHLYDLNRAMRILHSHWINRTAIRYFYIKKKENEKKVIILSKAYLSNDLIPFIDLVKEYKFVPIEEIE